MRPDGNMSTEPATETTTEGESGNVAINIATIRLRNGQEIPLPGPGVTAIVGGNNVGKSTLLKQVLECLDRSPSTPHRFGAGYRLVDSLLLHVRGSGSDFVAWLRDNADLGVSRGGRAQGFVRFGQQQPLDAVSAKNKWEHLYSDPSPGYLVDLAGFLVLNADWENRRNMSGGVEIRQDADSAPQHPFHGMQDDHSLVRRLSEMTERLFGAPLTLDVTGRTLTLRVGSSRIPAPRLDESHAAYRAEMAGLPQLSEQGDGMRSFVGLLLPLLTAKYPIVVIDEPEAFLHPPQAAEMGRILGTLASENKVQIILATHDRNILRGLLDANVPISIVRLHRTGNATTAHQLEPSAVRALWTSPTLRYTNVLDGLFHRVAVVAEADRDCHFYAAALTEANRLAPSQIPPSEVHFIPSYGKQAMAGLIKALTAVRVPVVVSPDLDILSSKQELVTLVQALGGDWSEFDRDYRVATAPFVSPREPARCRDALNAVTSILQNRLDDVYDSKIRESVMAQLRSRENPWKNLKTAGDRAFQGAQAIAAGQRLLKALDAIGVVTVRVGELERFARTIDEGKGVAWLTAALNAGEHRTQDAADHVRRVITAAATKEAHAARTPRDGYAQ